MFSTSLRIQAVKVPQMCTTLHRVHPGEPYDVEVLGFFHPTIRRAKVAILHVACDDCWRRLKRGHLTDPDVLEGYIKCEDTVLLSKCEDDSVLALKQEAVRHVRQFVTLRSARFPIVSRELHSEPSEFSLMIGDDICTFSVPVAWMHFKAAYLPSGPLFQR